MNELLDPGLLAQLERLQLASRRRLAGRFTGEHRSPRFGNSLDFADEREYHPGDDYRRIDYPLYARTGQLFVRLFEAEDELNLRILLDTSASMGHYGKLPQAVRLAAAIGFLALTRRDVVTLHLEPPSRPAQRFSGRHAVGALFGVLGGLETAGPTDLRSAAKDLLSRPGPAGATIVISDMLTHSWESAIDQLPARGGDVTVLHVLAAEEVSPGLEGELSGDVDVVDAETGQRLAVSLSHDSVKTYAAAVRAWLADCSARCRARGAAYQLVMAEQPIAEVVLGGLRANGVAR